MPSPLSASPRVAAALADGQAVVALESTIISHGMPYPANVETALQVEAAIVEIGACPATIGLIGGQPTVGLTEAEMNILARGEATKISRRDLAVAMAGNLHGGTTVAATMILAHMAGIRVFATGGIGGVHRGFAETMDVSADLEELARTRVTVVCAGIKSILDLPRTLEYLETRGVPVIGFGTDELPAFYCRKSGLGVDYRIDTVGELASILRAQDEMRIESGILVTNPLPKAFALEPEFVEAHIETALAAMKDAGIGGKEATPFLLERVAELSGGESLASNRELIVNNARLAAELAVAYAAR